MQHRLRKEPLARDESIDLFSIPLTDLSYAHDGLRADAITHHHQVLTLTLKSRLESRELRNFSFRDAFKQVSCALQTFRVLHKVCLCFAQYLNQNFIVQVLDTIPSFMAFSR